LNVITFVSVVLESDAFLRPQPGLQEEISWMPFLKLFCLVINGILVILKCCKWSNIYIYIYILILPFSFTAFFSLTWFSVCDNFNVSGKWPMLIINFKLILALILYIFYYLCILLELCLICTMFCNIRSSSYLIFVQLYYLTFIIFVKLGNKGQIIFIFKIMLSVI
jgi:hypothetical protein